MKALDTVTDMSVEELVELLILRKVAKKEDFTAYTITREVRQEVGKDINVPHDEVRSWVTTYMAENFIAVYDRVESEVKPGVYAMLFSPRDPVAELPQDIEDYTDGKIPDTTPSPNGEVFRSYLFKDFRGRVCIPAALVKEMGLKPGDKVTTRDCWAENEGCLEITKPESILIPRDNSPYIRDYTVDKDFNVRISPTTLHDARLNGSNLKVHSYTAENGDVVLYLR